MPPENDDSTVVAERNPPSRRWGLEIFFHSDFVGEPHHREPDIHRRSQKVLPRTGAAALREPRQRVMTDQQGWDHCQLYPPAAAPLTVNLMKAIREPGFRWKNGIRLMIVSVIGPNRSK